MGVDLLNVKGLQALDPSAPVVMVNLMRFRERSLDGDGSGWDAYLRYSALTVPMIKARGGTLLWTGDAKAVALGLEAGNTWDYLALVYYPTVAAFIDMMTSKDYETRCDPHRTNGCAEHVIIATREAYSKFKGSRSPDGAQRNPGQSRTAVRLFARIDAALHPGYRARQADQMRGMPASLITFDHLSVSEMISARISSGVLPRTSPPVAVSSAVFVAGSASIDWISVLSRFDDVRRRALGDQ